jgi:hypothetical protein
MRSLRNPVRSDGDLCSVHGSNAEEEGPRALLILRPVIRNDDQSSRSARLFRVRRQPLLNQMALTEQSIVRALNELDDLSTGVGVGLDSDPTSLEMARLLAVVDTANSGDEYLPDQAWTRTDTPYFGVKGGKSSVIEKLGELITKLRTALVDLVRTIAGAVSFSIGLTGPVLSVSVNFGV